jgi:hypothetical protein
MTEQPSVDMIALAQRRGGPVHELPDGHVPQSVARCGVKIGKYLSTKYWYGNDPAEVTCTKCVALAKAGKRKAWHR